MYMYSQSWHIRWMGAHMQSSLPSHQPHRGVIEGLLPAVSTKLYTHDAAAAHSAPVNVNPQGCLTSRPRGFWQGYHNSTRRPYPYMLLLPILYQSMWIPRVVLPKQNQGILTRLSQLNQETISIDSATVHSLPVNVNHQECLTTRPRGFWQGSYSPTRGPHTWLLLLIMH